MIQIEKHLKNQLKNAGGLVIFDNRSPTLGRIGRLLGRLYIRKSEKKMLWNDIKSGYPDKMDSFSLHI